MSHREKVPAAASEAMRVALANQFWYEGGLVAEWKLEALRDRALAGSAAAEQALAELGFVLARQPDLAGRLALRPDLASGEVAARLPQDPALPTRLLHMPVTLRRLYLAAMPARPGQGGARTLERHSLILRHLLEQAAAARRAPGPSAATDLAELWALTPPHLHAAYLDWLFAQPEAEAWLAAIAPSAHQRLTLRRLARRGGAPQDEQAGESGTS